MRLSRNFFGSLKVKLIRYQLERFVKRFWFLFLLCLYKSPCILYNCHISQYCPYSYFTNGQIWANKNMPHVVISIADIQIKEVDKYLRILETECAKLNRFKLQKQIRILSFGRYYMSTDLYMQL